MNVEQAQFESWISPARFAPYLRAAGDYETALALYEWNCQVSAGALESVGHAEVIVRNAMDRVFREFSGADSWLDDSSILNSRSLKSVEEARGRIRQSGKSATHDRTVAALSFGFWRAQFNKRSHVVWSAALHAAFPNSSGSRREVAEQMSDLNQWRNRLAHHDPVFAYPILDREASVFELCRWVDADAGLWVESRSRVAALMAARPVTNAQR